MKLSTLIAAFECCQAKLEGFRLYDSPSHYEKAYHDKIQKSSDDLVAVLSSIDIDDKLPRSVVIENDLEPWSKNIGGE